MPSGACVRALFSDRISQMPLGRRPVYYTAFRRNKLIILINWPFLRILGLRVLRIWRVSFSPTQLSIGKVLRWPKLSLGKTELKRIIVDQPCHIICSELLRPLHQKCAENIGERRGSPAPISMDIILISLIFYPWFAVSPRWVAAEA
jgi:hypothetical protein